MKNWPLVALDEVFEIARGGSPRPIDDFFTEDTDGINWVLIGDASDSSKYITKTRKRIRKEGASKSRPVRPGDFLLSNSMSFGKPYIMGTSGCIHDGWLVLTKRRDNVDSDFFYHLLGSSSVYSEFVRRAAGATVKNLNIELVKGVKIPLPPIAEQRRIAAILDKAEALRTKRRQALAKLDTLTQSLFLEMFGDPLSNPKVLPSIPLGNVATFVGGGTPSRANSAFFDGNICWASAKDVRGEYLATTQEHITEEAIAASATKLVKSGSILVVVKSKVLMRRLPVAISRVDICFGQDLKAIIPQEGWNARYIARHLRLAQSWLLDKARGANTEGLTLDHLRRFPILEAPKESRELYCKLDEKISQARMCQESQLEALDQAFASLQNRAFQGDL